MKCKYTEQELQAFISRADTHERVRIAENFLKNLPGLDNDLYNDLMMGLSYISRELYREDSRTAKHWAPGPWDDEAGDRWEPDYSPSAPWNAPGMSVRDFI